MFVRLFSNYLSIRALVLYPLPRPSVRPRAMLLQCSYKWCLQSESVESKSNHDWFALRQE